MIVLMKPSGQYSFSMKELRSFYKMFEFIVQEAKINLESNPPMYCDSEYEFDDKKFIENHPMYGNLYNFYIHLKDMMGE